MKKKTVLLAALTLFAALTFTSCSTTIHATIERPAQLDLNGADTIAVLPIQVSESGLFQNSGIIGDIYGFFSTIRNINNDSLEIADYITRNLERNLSYSEYIDLVYSDSVKGALENGLPAPCDVYLSGTITRYNNEIKKESRKVKVDGKDKIVDYYTREVSFDLSYQVIDAATNRIISVNTVSLNEESYNEEKLKDVPDAMDTVRYELDSIVDDIMRQLQPYTVVKSISLLKDKSKDPDMKTADALAKKGLIEASRDMYLELYRTRYYFEAGYNAAVILEALGDFDGAYEEMQALAKKTGDRRAISAMNDIKREIDSRDTLKKQLEK